MPSQDYQSSRTKTNLRGIFVFTEEEHPCRERRKIEEYSSLEVTDSGNNSIKESVEFSKPSFKTNLASESELLLHFQFGIRAAEGGREGCELSSLFSVFCLCFKMEERRAIYSVPGMA